MLGAAFTRRKALAGLASIAGAGAAGRLLGLPRVEAARGKEPAGHAMHGAGMQGMHDPLVPGSLHTGFAAGRTTVDPKSNGFDPSDLVRDFDGGKTRTLASGRVLREWELVAGDKEIEVAPGVKFLAWTYNGRVPGPTLRCTEGELLRIRFVNAASHPHTIHFHGFHRDVMDGIPGVGEEIGGGLIRPGASFTYEFDAEPFGLHLYHCHASPLDTHIARGLYGAFLIDPGRGRQPADELVMVQNAFDTNFDGDNELYAVNTVAFHYMYRPITVRRGELVRIYLVNVVELDPINSFHVHANFFHRFPTGTSLEPTEFTDTIMQAQGQRDILELRFRYPGKYMFHAHKSEFAQLGWMGLFEVVD